jgi:hypothetical protein
MAEQRSNIVGFIHVCMINDWKSIISEQINIMQESGLYDYMRVANVCCLGSEYDKEELEKLIEPFGKLRLAAYSPDLNAFEFFTLAFMKDVCNRSQGFYGFYIHTKGVSWPGHEGGKYWRDYMNHYILRKWMLDVRFLNIGYDLCGVKLINKGWPLHYSGNFFWFNAEYVSRVIPVNMMNRKDRFNAEMWVCSGTPIAATLCQDFVDYDTKGIFNPNEKAVPNGLL